MCNFFVGTSGALRLILSGGRRRIVCRCWARPRLQIERGLRVRSSWLRRGAYTGILPRGVHAVIAGAVGPAAVRARHPFTERSAVDPSSGRGYVDVPIRVGSGATTRLVAASERDARAHADVCVCPGVRSGSNGGEKLRGGSRAPLPGKEGNLFYFFLLTYKPVVRL